MRDKFQKKSLKELPEENEDIQETNEDTGEMGASLTATAYNTLNKKQVNIKPTKTPLIDKIDDELNQIEYCDTYTDNKQIDFEKNVEYFIIYLVDKLFYAFENDQQEINLANLNLTSDLFKDLDIVQSSSFKNSFEQLKFPSDQAKPKANEYLSENLKKIRTLDLGKNKLKELPLKFIELFQNLEILRCNENYFDSIKITISQENASLFGSLRIFDLNSNLIRSVKIDLSKSKTIFIDDKFRIKLENLNLSNNKLTIKEIDSCNFLLKLGNLKYLNFSGNSFSTLPWQIISLSNLTELNFSNNFNLNLCDISVLRQKYDNDNGDAHSTSEEATANIDELFVKNFSNLKSLKVLDLSGSNLNNLPNDIRELNKLEVLFLDKNNLEFIPTQIQELANLRVLSINENKLQEISKNFCLSAKFKKNLVIFNLRKNNLNNENFTEFFFVFQNLLKLDLSENQFRQIPNALPESLEELKINTNKVNTLNIKMPFSDGLGMNVNENDFDDLKQYEFVIQRFSTKEPAINPFYLRNLRRLHLRKNNLKEVPADFGLLNTSLEYLDLSSNLINQFDSSLCRGFTCLQHLNLNSNYIRYIPEQIRELQHLRYLNLSKNQVCRLNFEICNELPNLTELNLQNNCLEELPVFKKDGKQISVAQLAAVNEQYKENIPKQVLFTFDLKNLARIDLSSNRFHSIFSLYTTFALCPNLEEINLDSNQISNLDFDRLDEEEEAPQQQTVQPAPLPDKDKPREKEKSKLDLRQAKSKLDNPPAPPQSSSTQSTATRNKKCILLHLDTINLSNNRLEFTKGGFLKMLLSLYKLAPNLKRLVYNQLNGSKLGGVANMNNNRDFNLYFDYFQDENDEKSNSQFQLLTKNLRILDLSNNNLNKIPTIIRKMQNLKEIYLNGNAIEKLPRDLLNINKTITSVSNDASQKQLPAINENIEVLQLNDNKLEQIPENLFMHFKNLKQIQVHNNPLREPPKGAMCADFDECGEDIQDFKEIWNQNVTEFFQDSLEVRPNSTELVDDGMKPIRSYMLKYKKREGKLVFNDFAFGYAVKFVCSYSREPIVQHVCNHQRRNRFARHLIQTHETAQDAHGQGRAGV
jgi:leucine-rich repeat protein SHOC2